MYTIPEGSSPLLTKNMDITVINWNYEPNEFIRLQYV